MPATILRAVEPIKACGDEAMPAIDKKMSAVLRVLEPADSRWASRQCIF